MSGLLASCGTVAPLPREYRVTVADIVNNVRCEFKRASRDLKYLREGPGWGSATSLSLQVVTSADIGFDPKLDAPLSPGLLVVTANAKYLGKADSTASFKFTQDLDNWEKIPCPNETFDRDGMRQLHGNLRIFEWLENVGQTMSATGSEIPEAGYTVEFTIEKGGGGGPTFSLVPAGNNLFGAALKAGVSRKDVHKIIIAFSRNPPPKKDGAKGGGSAAGDKARLDQLNVLTIIDASKDR
jgi:hypothetical protein